MKICYVSSNLGVHDERFLNKFVENKYEVHVVSFTKNKTEDKNGIKFYNHYIEIKGKSLKSLLNIYKSAHFLKNIIKEIKPDVLHGGYTHEDGFLSALTGFHPFLLMPWGSDILIGPKKSIVNRLRTKYAIKKADMITCDAEFVKNEIIKLTGYPPDKIVVFPQGIDLKKFNTKVDGSEIRNKLGWEDKKILIMTRNFQPVYGIEYFLEALPEVIKEKSDVRVILCGDGPLRDKFTQIVTSRAIDEYVFFAGHISNDELPNYFRRADIYVSSSLSDGTLLSLLEAMACGLPVVITDVPSILEWIEDGKNGFVVPRQNSKILAGKIIDLLNDEKLRREFSSKNIKIAEERANWDKNFNKLEKMYEILIRNK